MWKRKSMEACVFAIGVSKQSLTEHITVHNAIGVFLKWIITALG